MTNDVLVIVPSRGRPENTLDFYKSFIETSTISDLCFGLDDDDVEYPRINGVTYEINPRLRMNGTLNLIANKYADQYKYIAFLGDDHRPRTQGWDQLLVDSIKDLNNGIAYGNDLLAGADLPTAVLMDARIVKALGYMAPPSLIHLYMDNFWRDMGNELGSLRYLPDVILEHMHYSAGKSIPDFTYLEANAREMFQRDANSYQDYVRSGNFALDAEKLRNA
jgi:hypothetical protein